MKTLFSLLSCFVCCISITSAMADSRQVTAPAGVILSAWSQIVAAEKTDSPQPAIVGRFVVQGLNRDCSAFTFKSGTGSTGFKAAARSNPDPDSFPITLCQAMMQADWSDVSLLLNKKPALIWSADGRGPDVTFSGPAKIGSKHKDEIVMITLGDTGCRGKKDQPHCSASNADWPFYKLIQVAATDYEPDLVIHVGDYRYFQEGHTADTWFYWYQDFFSPAQKLLLATPWAFARGNHEQCHNAWAPYWYGSGWLYFFEPTTSLETTLCPEKPDEILIDPWYFDVTFAELAPHRFIMIDTAPDFPANEKSRKLFSQQMHNQLSSALDMASEAAGAWWISHRPFQSLSYYKNSWHFADKNIRKVLNSVLAGRAPLCHPECSPNTILSGHMHQYQNIRYFTVGNTSGSWLWPQTMIVGNGGVADVEGLNKNPCTYDKFPLDATITGIVSWNTNHGFVSWSRSVTSSSERSGWLAKPYFLNNHVSKTKDTTGTCEPASIN